MHTLLTGLVRASVWHFLLHALWGRGVFCIVGRELGGRLQSMPGGLLLAAARCDPVHFVRGRQVLCCARRELMQRLPGRHVQRSGGQRIVCGVRSGEYVERAKR